VSDERDRTVRVHESCEPRRAKDVRDWAVTTDVLVVGLGCAGASAAIEAARAGADVLVVERASGGGGTSSMSGGVIYLGGGTGLQRACGFEDSSEEMFKYLMASCGPRPDEEKIRVYCERSVEHYDWFVAQGVPFKPVFYPHYSGEPPTDDGLVFSGSEEAWPFCEIARPAPRGHVAQTPNQTGWLLMQKLIAAVEAAGARIVTDTRVLGLVVSDDGDVVGAIAKRDGREFRVRARKGVVLAAGGFVNNRRMLETHAPLLGRCKFRVGAEGDDGSGIRMATAAGAAAVNLGMGSISLPIIPPKTLQKGILVNRFGQRFINEDAYYGRLGEYALLRNDGIAYLVLDSETFVRPEVERAVAGVGETIEELEAALELPAGSLAATVELYNRHARNGVDPVFHKAQKWVKPLDPPYGALDCRVDTSLYAVFTLGGLQTDVDGRVLSADGDPLSGLYSAGRTSASISCPGYSSGLSIGDGTFFGRRAGAAAAR